MGLGIHYLLLRWIHLGNSTVHTSNSFYLINCPELHGSGFFLCLDFRDLPIDASSQSSFAPHSIRQRTRNAHKDVVWNYAYRHQFSKQHCATMFARGFKLNCTTWQRVVVCLCTFPEELRVSVVSNYAYRHQLYKQLCASRIFIMFRRMFPNVPKWGVCKLLILL